MIREVCVVDMVGGVWAAPPVDEETILAQFADSTLKRDNIPGIELLLLHEPAPTFGHYIALTAIPVGISEAPRLSIPVFEIEKETFLVGRGIQRKILFGVLFGDD